MPISAQGSSSRVCLHAASQKMLSSILCHPHLYWLTWLMAGITFYFLCPRNNTNVKGKFPPKVWKDRVWHPDTFTGDDGHPLVLGSPAEFHLLRRGDVGDDYRLGTERVHCTFSCKHRSGSWSRHQASWSLRSADLRAPKPNEDLIVRVSARPRLINIQQGFLKNGFQLKPSNH